MSAIAPITIRAELSNEEWIALRQLALAKQVRVSNLVGQAIREYLDLNQEGSVKT